MISNRGDAERTVRGNGPSFAVIVKKADAATCCRGLCLGIVFGVIGGGRGAGLGFLFVWRMRRRRRLVVVGRE